MLCQVPARLPARPCAMHCICNRYATLTVLHVPMEALNGFCGLRFKFQWALGRWMDGCADLQVSMLHEDRVKWHAELDLCVNARPWNAHGMQRWNGDTKKDDSIRRQMVLLYGVVHLQT